MQKDVVACFNAPFQDLLRATKENYGETWAKFCACNLSYLK